MEIVICGGGKVGEELCRDLSYEGHDVVLIEEREKRLDHLINSIDISGVKGNGALSDVQHEAGVENCDAYIAVTPDDETNIIASLTARSLGAKHVVARVRGPEYSAQMNFLRESLGIHLLINPEFESAREISYMLRFSTVLNVEHFENGQVLIVETILAAESLLVGKSLSEIGRRFGDVLVCVVKRGEKTIIPSGDFVLQAGDHLYLSGKADEIRMFCSGGKRRPQRIKTVLIVGGGRLTRYLLRLLEPLNVRAKVIELDDETADRLAADYPNVEVVCGDGTSQFFLKQERMSLYDAVISLTGIDEENLLVSIYASRQGVKKTVTKVNRTDLLDVLDDVGLQAIVTPKRIIADQIIRFIRSLENTTGNNIDMFYRLADGQAEALQFSVGGECDWCGRSLSELQIKPGTLVLAIIRDHRVIYPHGRDMLLTGDKVIVVATSGKLRDLKDIFI
ncbi:MAG: Trk system potassium transporter TrkA [Fastidiosipilaceae bacterium]|jgi:trk system potassium uptake protein TrkA